MSKRKKKLKYPITSKSLRRMIIKKKTKARKSIKQMIFTKLSLNIDKRTIIKNRIREEAKENTERLTIEEARENTERLTIEVARENTEGLTIGEAKENIERLIIEEARMSTESLIIEVDLTSQEVVGVMSLQEALHSIMKAMRKRRKEMKLKKSQKNNMIEKIIIEVFKEGHTISGIMNTSQEETEEILIEAEDTTIRMENIEAITKRTMVTEVVTIPEDQKEEENIIQIVRLKMWNINPTMKTTSLK